MRIFGNVAQKRPNITLHRRVLTYLGVEILSDLVGTKVLHGLVQLLQCVTNEG